MGKDRIFITYGLVHRLYHKLFSTHHHYRPSENAKRNRLEPIDEEEQKGLFDGSNSSFSAILFSILTLCSKGKSSRDGEGKPVGKKVHDEASEEERRFKNVPEASEPSVLLSDQTRSAIYASLPALVLGRKWLLLYSTRRHGISLSTLYRRSMLWPGLSLLVVGDKNGAVFGGIVEAPIMPIKNKYQGTSSSFVFTNKSGKPVIFRPTGANRYFTLCSKDFLAVGGGSRFALHLDGELLSGSSSASETYGNPCLANSENFGIKDVELWGFVYRSKYDEILALTKAEEFGVCRW